MDKMDVEIMVVKNDYLFKNYERETKFYNGKDFLIEKIILENFEYMRRWNAEVNFDYKQPITYAVILNKNNEIFVYKRWWKSSNNWETRLADKIAIGIGGHLDKEEYLENPLKEWLLREVEEEIWLTSKDIDLVEAIWFINNEENELNQVHIWAAYMIKINNDEIKLLDWELEKWEFLSVENYEKMINSNKYDIEPWSKILLEPLKQYLNK